MWIGLARLLLVFRIVTFYSQYGSWGNRWQNRRRGWSHCGRRRCSPTFQDRYHRIWL
jgi:hypothetical protein